jgi:hypothetical protein
MALSFYSLFDLLRGYNKNLGFYKSGDSVTIKSGKDIIFQTIEEGGEKSALLFLEGMLTAYKLGAN